MEKFNWNVRMSIFAPSFSFFGLEMGPSKVKLKVEEQKVVSEFELEALLTSYSHFFPNPLLQTYCALGSAWEAGTRLIWWKPFILGPEDPPDRWTAFWNQAHQKHGHPNQGQGEKIFRVPTRSWRLIRPP